MENKFRNEMEITVGGQKILLRPTFENLAAMESVLGSLAYLGWKYSRGVVLEKDGTIKTNMEMAIRSLPPLSDAAKIIFFNQAATKPEDPTLKKYSLEEIWALVLEEGTPVTKQVVQYLARVTAGNKTLEGMGGDEEKEKKS